MSGEVATQDDNTVEQPKLSVVASSAHQIARVERIARFRNRPMVMEYDPYPHFVPLHKDRFERIAYPLLGGITRSRMNDIFSYLSNIAEDLSVNDRYILFGLADGKNGVWDMQELEWVDVDAESTIWRSPYAPLAPRAGGSQDYRPVPFIMSLAGGDKAVYDDIMQSLAPLVMETKPDGVIWWVGDGANGKSTLMDAIYRIFPGQLSSLTVKRLVDGRDTPSLNGTLANIVKESSEGRVEDTEIYKAIGTHENFRVHKFHSQDDVEVRGNMHHIFSANTVPSFNDKGYSARRRTFIVPFTQRFESDPSFESRTFTAQMFGELVMEMTRYALQLRRQGYKYKWSAQTLGAKMEYDTEANNAEEYARSIVQEGVVAFESFNPVRMDYEHWCADNGYVPLGIGNLRKAMSSSGFERVTIRYEGATTKIYRVKSVHDTNLQPFGMSRPGLFSVAGFREAEADPIPIAPDFNEPVEDDDDPEPVVEESAKKTSVLNGKW